MGLTRGLAGVTGGVLGAGLMAAAQLTARQPLRRVATPGPVADSGIGFQAGFRIPEPAMEAAKRFLRLGQFAIRRPVFSSLSVHAAFGALAGFVQAEVAPRGPGFAVVFGGALWLLGTEIALPALRLTKTPKNSSSQIQAFGLAEHLLYAVVVDQIVASYTTGNEHKPAVSLSR